MIIRFRSIANAGTGKTQDLTPEGLFTITVKAKNPYYRKKNIPGRNSAKSTWHKMDWALMQKEQMGEYTAFMVRIIRIRLDAMSQMDVSVYKMKQLNFFIHEYHWVRKFLIQSSSKSFEDLAIEYGAMKYR